jgi:hypothetical protein
VEANKDDEGCTLQSGDQQMTRWVRNGEMAIDRIAVSVSGLCRDRLESAAGVCDGAHMELHQ